VLNFILASMKIVAQALNRWATC